MIWMGPVVMKGVGQSLGEGGGVGISGHPPGIFAAVAAEIEQEHGIKIPSAIEPGYQVRQGSHLFCPPNDQMLSLPLIHGLKKLVRVGVSHPL